MHTKNPWWRGLVVLGAIKLLIGVVVALTLIGDPESRATRLTLHLSYMLSFGLVAGLLIIGARNHRAGRELGVFLLLIATTFAEAAIRGSPHSFSASLRIFEHLPLDAFLPYLLWRFVGEFPQVSLAGARHKLLSIGKLLSGGFGLALFLANALLFETAPSSTSPTGAAGGVLELVRKDPSSYYWPILFLLMLTAFAFGLLKTTLADTVERRRGTSLVAALALGAAPLIVTAIVMQVSDEFRVAYLTPGVFQTRLERVMDAFLMSVPFTTAYVVLFHRVIPLKVILRRVLEYLLARTTLMTLTAAPFAASLTLLYRRRQETLDSIFSGPDVVVLGALTALGILAIRARPRLLEILDRRFFRERYDARRILISLAERARTAPDINAISGLLCEEIDRALHLEVVDVLILDITARTLRSQSERARALPVDSVLIQKLDGPLELDLEESTEVADLTSDERHWLVDSGFRLLVPILDSSSQLIGVIALGEKRSGVEFTEDDLLLLNGVAAAASLRLDSSFSSGGGTSGAPTLGTGEYSHDSARLNSRPSAGRRRSTRSPELLGHECSRCGLVDGHDKARCSSCGGAVAANGLPRVLAGKFLFEAKIGQGGMGVVYRAEDLDLGRRVAIKTLPSQSSRRLVRLRREARTMASVSHPNLALIYGAESWRGQPLLIFEFLSGGTLTDRLKDGPLEIRASVDLISAMTAVTERLHEHGILHRDIKPSNIGYTDDDTPKLLDFGLAKLVLDANPTEELDDEDLPLQDQTAVAAGEGNYPVMGTLPYLSPEALEGARPDYSFDVWSLATVLFECITGSNPFLGATKPETIDRIRRGPTPSLKETLPDAPTALDSLLTRALSREPDSRPQSAKELREALSLV